MLVVDPYAVDGEPTPVVWSSENPDPEKSDCGPALMLALGPVRLLRSLSQESSYAGGRRPELERVSPPPKSGPPSWCRRDVSVRGVDPGWIAVGVGSNGLLDVPTSEFGEVSDAKGSSCVIRGVGPR